MDCTDCTTAQAAPLHRLQFCQGCTSARLHNCTGCTSAQAAGSTNLHRVWGSCITEFCQVFPRNPTAVVPVTHIMRKGWLGCADTILRGNNLESSLLCTEAWNRIQGCGLCISQIQNFLSSSQTSVPKKSLISWCCKHSGQALGSKLYTLMSRSQSCWQEERTPSFST